jgi:hypothetical protein
MACSTLTSILKSCDNNIGGITSIYINDQDNVDANEIVIDSQWTITDFGTLAVPFVPFEFRRNTGMYTEEAAIDLVNGSSFITQTVTLIFHRREASKSKAIKILGEGQRDLALIVGDANGKYWYFPKAQLTAVAEGSGTAKADGSKYSITFVAENENLAYEVVPSLIPDLI